MSKLKEGLNKHEMMPSRGVVTSLLLTGSGRRIVTPSTWAFLGSTAYASCIAALSSSSRRFYNSPTSHDSATVDVRAETELRSIPISKLLIANRGEIACRVIASARRLGIPTVTVFSEADKLAIHARSADEAFCIGPAAARDSYLRMDRILDVRALPMQPLIIVCCLLLYKRLHPSCGTCNSHARMGERVHRWLPRLAQAPFILAMASCQRILRLRLSARKLALLLLGRQRRPLQQWVRCILIFVISEPASQYVATFTGAQDHAAIHLCIQIVRILQRCASLEGMLRLDIRR